MTFSQALSIRRGVTAVIGSGGKTTLLRTLARELQPQGTVLLCTTTRIYPPQETRTLLDASEEMVRAALRAFRVVCIGSPVENGKLAAPVLEMEMLCRLVDYVLVEADGSKRLPLKAHGAHEPVIPPEANQTVCVVGLSGLGKPIGEAAHRAERYATLAGALTSDMVTPARAVQVLNAEGLGDRILLNQADSPKEQALALEMKALISMPVTIGSLKENVILC